MEREAQGAVGYRWSFANVEFDESRWELRVAGVPVDLERKPLELLAQLLRHAGEVLTKDELLESVWTGRIVVEAALTNAIGKLRRALGDEAQHRIVTVPRVGYRLDGPVSRKAVPPLPLASVLAAGDAVPRRTNYRLVERLARNEDSEVWRAEQPKTHEVRVFKFSLDGARLPALKREVTLSRLLRDALGERDEFVRILDWDFEQAPYFLESEYGGLSLDTWFEQRAPPPGRAQRLALIAETADAVAAAHEVGVLHKDLKPANVLVHGASGDWHPRLTDFGSGHVLEPGRLEALGITRLGLTRTQSLAGDSDSGTPLYLAPEVISGQSPSIKSDLYALGVILYQLLVGDFRRPLSPGWEADIDDPLLREDIAAFASGDPMHRPASARELAERLRTLDARRLRRDTELAVQDRIAASERKLALARARRPWVAAAMVLLVAGMAGSVFYALRAHRAQQTEAQARQEAQEATAQADRSLERADAVNAFLVQDVIGGADPFKTGQAALSLQEALDRAEKNIATRFKGQPEAEAQVRIMLAQAYSGRGEHALARDQYTQAVEAIEAAPAADQALAVQARLHKAGSLLNLGDFEGFDSTMAPALKAVDSDPTLDPKLRVHVNFVSGQKAMLAGDMPAAVARLEKAEMALKAVQDPNPALGLRVRSVLGMIYTQAGRHAQALKLLRAVVAEATEEYGVAHPETLNARILLGMALNGARRFDEAAQSLAATRRDAIATHGADSEPVLDADQLLAAAQIGRGKLQEGAELYASVYARREQRAGISNPQTLDLAAATADALRRVGRGAQALSLLDKAREAAAAIPLQARAAIVQKLDYVKACALVAEGRSLAAAQIADTLQPTVLATAAPQDDWPQRLQILHQALRVGVDTKVDPCPIFGVRG